jgi:hypothetical protein
MSIKVQCPNADCGKVAMVKDELAGKRAKCGCGTIVIIPNGTGVRTRPAGAVATAPRRPAAGQPAAVAQRRPAGPAPRSGMVMAIAIVSFVLGGLSILFGLLGFLVGSLFASAGRMQGDLERMAAQEFARQGAEFPGSGVGSSIAFLGTLMMILSIAFLLWGAMTIPSGIGLLKRRRWGRMLSLIVAGVAGLIALVSIVPIFIGGGMSTVLNILLYGGYAAWVFLVLLRARAKSEFA